jgi:uncharacterized protein
MRGILGLFGRSPFSPLMQHAERVHETVELIRPLTAAFVAGDWGETERIYETISDLEHRADELKIEIREHLPKSLFMPVNRGDILMLLKEQDSIADRAEDLGVLLTMRRTPTPDGLRQPFLDFIEHTISVSSAWLEVAREMPTLQEASFTGPEVDKTMERIRDISDMERAADDMQAGLSKLVFRHENDLDPISVVFWMNFARVLGSIANHAENTADLLRLMLARR